MSEVSALWARLHALQVLFLQIRKKLEAAERRIAALEQAQAQAWFR